MRRITFRLGDLEKRTYNGNKIHKSKEISYHGCGKKGHEQRDCKADVICAYCKNKGHYKSECRKLKRREQRNSMTSSSSSSSRAGGSSSQDQVTSAVVTETKDKFALSSPIVKIVKFNNSDCDIIALLDTGSPVSFVASNTFLEFHDSSLNSLEPVKRKFNALPKSPINVLGKANTTVQFENFPGRTFNFNVHIVGTDFTEIDIVIGRDFLEEHKLILIYDPSCNEENSFTQLLLHSDVCYTNSSVESILDESEIDFDLSDKERLKKNNFRN